MSVQVPIHDPLEDVSGEKVVYLQQKLWEFGLLPGFLLQSAHKATYVVLHGTTYSKSAVLVVGASGNPPLPIFGELDKIWIVGSYIYFETFSVTRNP
jgi:hypothetical protein